MSNFNLFQHQKRGQSATPTSSFTRLVRPFAPLPSPSSQTAYHDGRASLDHAAHFGHSFAQISLLPPNRPSIETKPVGIQRKVRITAPFLGEMHQEKDASAETIRKAAQEGVRTTSSELPYAEQIQQSFGHHNIGQINAHMGTKATASAAAMHAVAYATGNHVVFAGNPNLYTTAHEAAHIVQQRSSMLLTDGIGRVGDIYEQNADSVAKRVMTGQLAEDLLDRFAAWSHGPVNAVQRSTFIYKEEPRKTTDYLLHDDPGLYELLRDMKQEGDWEGIESLHEALQRDLKSNTPLIKQWVEKNHEGIMLLITQIEGVLEAKPISSEVMIAEAPSSPPARSQKAEERKQKSIKKKVRKLKEASQAQIDPAWWKRNPQTLRWGHTFRDHGQAMAGDSAIERAMGTQEGASGVWVDDDRAKEHLIKIRPDLDYDTAQVGLLDLPDGLGVEYTATGQQRPAKGMFYKLNKEGGFVTAFPTNQDAIHGDESSDEE